MLPLAPLRRSTSRVLLTLAALGMAGCASLAPGPAPEDIGQSAWARQSRAASAPAQLEWAHHPLPGKTATRFQAVRKDGRDALAAQADASASLVRYPLRVEPEALGQLRFSWQVPALIAQADLALRDKADAPVRIILAFDGDRSKLSGRDAALSELMRAVLGEEMPYATLMYVWCNQRTVGTVIRSPRTDRIRKLVVESGPARLNQWLDYERDVRADYERVFGEKPGALIGVALMTDSDNTQSHASAWYGPVRFGAAGAPSVR